MTLPVREVELAVIGGGSAGLAAASEAKRNGIDDVVMIDRNPRLGGILPQCIHSGFGLEMFGTEMTGPEFVNRLVMDAKDLGIESMSNAMVIDMAPLEGGGASIIASSSNGIIRIDARAVILAMGCRERTRDNILIPGTRPAGVYTAGTAQNLINMHDLMIGRKVVVLGSGDVGLIMARRLTLEGAKVELVAEVMPFAGGLERNVHQCLNDFGIPLLLSHTVVEIRGQQRVESVVISEVDNDMRPILGTEREVECDTLLLSVGLIPENELSQGCGIELDPLTGGPTVDSNFMTTVPGIFACGNVLHVHDVVDWVALEGIEASRGAVRYLEGNAEESSIIAQAGKGVAYVLPHRLDNGGAVLKLRIEEPARDVDIIVKADGTGIRRVRHPRLLPSQMVFVETGPLPEGTVEVEVVLDG